MDALNQLPDSSSTKPTKSIFPVIPESAKTIVGTEADDVLSAPEGNYDNGIGVTISALGGNDRLRGSLALDRLDGGDGDDYISDPGNFAKSGDGDILLGGNGDDTLVGGGPGRTTMTGGAGADTYRIASYTARSTSKSFSDGPIGFTRVTDFNKAEGDKVDITGLPINSNGSFRTVDSAAAAEVSDGMLVYDEKAGNLYFNPNGTEAGFASVQKNNDPPFFSTSSTSGGLFASFDGAPTLTKEDFGLIDLKIFPPITINPNPGTQTF